MLILHLRRFALAGAVGLLAAGTLGATPAAAAENAQVSVVHGIPGQPVDVCVNGEKSLPVFQPGMVAGPRPSVTTSSARLQKGWPCSAIHSAQGSTASAGCPSSFGVKVFRKNCVEP